MRFRSPQDLVIQIESRVSPKDVFNGGIHPNVVSPLSPCCTGIRYGCLQVLLLSRDLSERLALEVDWGPWGTNVVFWSLPRASHCLNWHFQSGPSSQTWLKSKTVSSVHRTNGEFLPGPSWTDEATRFESVKPGRDTQSTPWGNYESVG